MLTLCLVTALSIVAFLLVFQGTGVIPVARAALATVRAATETMRDPAIDDLAREQAVQAAALRLILSTGSLVLRGVLALLAACIPILAADWAGFSSTAATLAFLERWDVIVVAALATTLVYVIGVRSWSR